MKRTVKAPDIRRQEILTIAGDFFHAKGYRNTSVEEIIKKAGIAKGTFYHYFRSKEDVLDALVQDLVAQMVEAGRHIADHATLTAVEKIRLILQGVGQSAHDAPGEIMENLHLPENRELHERSNVETIRALGPVMADIVEQGNTEGVFRVELPLETVQFLLAGSLFLLDSRLFNWAPAEQIARTKAMQTIIERALGVEPGTFSFLASDNT